MGAFVGGYFVLGHLTYLRAIATIREVTGVDFYRANAVYKAALSGDWSKISTNELRVPVPPDPRLFLQKGSQAEFKRQLIAMIVMERSRRRVEQESSQMLREVWTKPLPIRTRRP